MKTKPQVIEADVAVTLTGGPKHCKGNKIRMRWTYDLTDPLAVTVWFYNKGFERRGVEWCFARTLLVEGAVSREGAGIGDVHIWVYGPWFDRRLAMKLISEDPKAEALIVTMALGRMKRFIRKMNLVVPFADLALDIPFDHELSLLQQQGRPA